MSTINWLNEAKNRQEDLITETQKFLQIPSILKESTANETQPFGQQIDEALQYLLKIGEKDEFFVKNVDGYAGIIELGTGTEMIGILCHLDVVPAGNGWSSPPFAAQIRDGRIYARGAMDDKGPTMAAYYAMKIIKESGLALSKRIRMIIGTDEESDWRCVDYYRQHEEMPSFGIAPDADFPIIHAEKGLLDLKLSFEKEEASLAKMKESQMVLQTFRAGERLNMVPDYAEAILVVKSEVEQQSVCAQFEQWLKQEKHIGSYEIVKDEVRISIKGISAHGSTPEKGINAAKILAPFLLKWPVQKRAKNYLSFITQQLDERGEALGIAVSDRISGALTVNAGTFSFEQDEDATVGLNIRCPVEVELNEVFFKLKNTLETLMVQCEIKSKMEANYVAEDEPEIKILQNVYERQTGEKATLLSTGGATYARALKKGVAFGAQFPGREDLAHQKDEHILIDDLIKMTAIYAEAFYELAK
ncbi:diguanylate cyclase [Alkalihalobacillus alcalophilus ATCC 27647 = CGMCC 1.3604]|uniref:Diguanylate cyclase n=1 Tax=Alkalihalobacillus alcalophilus ATCC 27647 = CGMCC 1.3604 TaxID=1218173 RepID=A0A094WRX1_ALKAL|nr:dipeptidase PepV [Alkalihalobacillus alcalophilus]KGA98763.1 dipeptidase PepV [Alkalihalobacillus alcalophilus ATCC 27647 = CGMCC 1.3604]MED1560943.1 dipeptidase PepV [Alkalihalobacillus alcalophilus]THG92169.1 diguanylate cyclase [Alkalihalobacillus alcalophilus ATCC 27647 = CGMCC 1.3604]